MRPAGADAAAAPAVARPHVAPQLHVVRVGDREVDGLAETDLGDLEVGDDGVGSGPGVLVVLLVVELALKPVCRVHSHREERRRLRLHLLQALLL